MKKINLLIGIIAIGTMFCTSSCDGHTTYGPKTILEEEEEEKQQEEEEENKKEGETETETPENPDITEEPNNTFTNWTDEELAMANTAANIESIAQVDRDIIFYCNLARLDGARFWTNIGQAKARGSQEYVSSLESTLQEIKGRPMFVPEKSLMAAAAYHANDMYENDFFAHNSSDGTSFGTRVYGFYHGNAIAENISGGRDNALEIVLQLLVDEGVTTLGHRKNILNEKYIAIGVKTGPHKTWRSVTVQDFGDKIIDRME